MMVESTYRAAHISSSPDTGWTRRHNSAQMPLCSQLRNRWYTVSHFPQSAGKSRQGLPARVWYSTASTNMRSPKIEGRPTRGRISASTASIWAHRASVRIRRVVMGGLRCGDWYPYILPCSHDLINTP